MPSFVETPDGDFYKNLTTVEGHIACASFKKMMAKAVRKKAAKKGTTSKNKLGVKNSLVNNINARKKKGKSRSKKKSTVDKKSYEKMEDNWGRKK